MNAGIKPIATFHASMEERLAAANRFVTEVPFTGEVVCDSFENEAVTRYNAHPERICIVKNNTLVHIGGAGPLVFYDIQGVINWLDDNFGYDHAASDEAVSGYTEAGKGAPASAPAAAVPSQEEEEGECAA
jgi:hypothetical protein